VPGAVTVTLGLIAIVYGFSRAAEDGWLAGSTLGLLDRRCRAVGGIRGDRTSLGESLCRCIFRVRSTAGRVPRRAAHPDRDVRDVPVPELLLPDHARYSSLKAGFAFLPFPGHCGGRRLTSALLPKIARVRSCSAAP